mmetsp:Transcript_26361/g.47316  ORF Transcript_26361/g.47316 Transcript_26361/m.47316 type:complete len:123 (+) Transcript_26361:401-769(+)
MAVPKLPELPKSHSTYLIGSARGRLTNLGQHSPPAYLRDSWAYTGRVKGSDYKVNKKEDTQLWRPYFPDNIYGRILSYRRKETLQDNLKIPARMNIAQLHRKKPHKHWMSAYNVTAVGKNLH